MWTGCRAHIIFRVGRCAVMPAVARHSEANQEGLTRKGARRQHLPSPAAERRTPLLADIGTVALQDRCKGCQLCNV